MKKYDSKSIQVLEGLEAVRVRPGMYIGSTGSRGLHHLLWEIVDNSIDEALGGHCNHIIITRDKDTIEVRDNGRGIPTDQHESGMSTVEVVLTKLHAGGKFDNDSYKFSGGLHGVGVSVVNALSSELEVNVYRDRKVFRYIFNDGVLTYGPEISNQIKGNQTGTSIKFRPNKKIFDKDASFDNNTICTRLRELAYLNKGLTIDFEDLKTKDKYRWKSSNGLVTFLKDLIGEVEDGESSATKPIYLHYSGTYNGSPAEAEVIFNYSDGRGGIELSFVNNIKTIDGGTHVSGFRSAFTKIINDLARSMGYLKDKDPNFRGEDIRTGLNVIISIKLSNPQFESQTKDKLGSVEAGPLVANLLNNELREALVASERDLNTIMKKISLETKARNAAKAQRDMILNGKKSGFDTLLPTKLASASSKNPRECELFLVEGRLQKLPS